MMLPEEIDEDIMVDDIIDEIGITNKISDKELEEKIISYLKKKNPLYSIESMHSKLIEKYNIESIRFKIRNLIKMINDRLALEEKRKKLFVKGGKKKKKTKKRKTKKRKTKKHVNYLSR